MSIPESVITAATIGAGDYRTDDNPAEARARRVILALVEEMPREALEEAESAYHNTSSTFGPEPLFEPMQAAIAAFLRHVAGDSL